MPIDASIYGNLQLPKLATLGEIAEARAQREDRQMVRDSRKLAMDKQQREAKELQTIQEVFTKYTGPDGPDQTAIVNELYRIAPDAAQKVQAGFAKLKKDAADARSSELDLETKRIAAVARSLQGVTPETYPAAFSRIRVIDPEAAEVLGPTYDPAKVDAVMSSGMAWSDYNTKYKDVLAAKEKDEVKALNLISLANDQNQYEDALDFAKVHGVASKLREMGFTDQFAPDVAPRAAQLTMTPKEREASAGKGGTASDYGRFEADYIDAEAAKLGKTAAQLSPDQRVKFKTAARRLFGQADDAARRPLAPIVIQTAAGPQILDRSSGTARGVTDATGNPIGPAPTTDMRNRVAGRQSAQVVLGSIADLSEKINTGKGAMAKVSGAVERAKAQANLNDDVSEYEAVVSGFTPLLARALGHTGVLTEQDVASVRTMLPAPGDSKNVRDRKIARIKTIMTSMDDGGGGGNNTGTKSVTTKELAAIAKRRGTTVEQEKQRATDAGYVVR